MSDDTNAGVTVKDGLRLPKTGGNAERHAEALDDGCDVLNEEFALVLLGSKALILWERTGGPVSDRLKFLTIEAFKSFHSNRTYRKVSINQFSRDETISYPNIANAWLRSKRRRTYDGVEFFPSVNCETGTTGYYNLWRGFSRAPDQTTPAQDRWRKYLIFRDHLLTNVCGGDEELFKWVFAWFAHMLQKPRERIGTALVLRGKMGVGKSIVGDIIGRLIALHYFLIDDPRHLTGNFNAHMMSCLLLQVDEGFWAGDKAAEGRLKGLITSEIQMIEAKGVDAIQLKNFVRLIFTSNEGWVVPAAMDERRFAVLDVGDASKENHGYFKEMYAELEAGGYEALLADLLSVDLSAADAPNLRSIPKTAALLEQKIRSFDPIQAWWHGRLLDGSQTHRGSQWEIIKPIRSLYQDYVRTAEKAGVRRKASEQEFGIALRKLVTVDSTRRMEAVEETGDDGMVVNVSKRVRCYVFPTLNQARAQFEAAIGQSLDWGKSDTDDHNDGGSEAS